MPFEYRPKKDKYYLPKSLYKSISWIIEDYNRLKDERISIIYKTPSNNGLPKGNDITDTTQEKAVKLEIIENKLKAIDQTGIEMKENIRSKVRIENDFDIIRMYTDYSYYDYVTGKSIRTWHRFKSEFTYKVGKKLKYF